MSAVNWVMVDDVAGEQWDSCERILDLRKGLGASMPIVVLGAQSAAEDRMLLLEVGNDNDLSKPVSPKELLARVRQVMEKLAGAAASRSVAPEEVVSFGDVRVDLASMVDDHRYARNDDRFRCDSVPVRNRTGQGLCRHPHVRSFGELVHGGIRIARDLRQHS